MAKKYTVVVEKDEDGWLVSEVVELPGCHTQAKTLAELTKRVREAITLCLDVAKADPHYRQRISRLAYEPSFIALDTVEV